MQNTPPLKVSLITTERNEADSIKDFIESALKQSLKPDEIVISDGGSTDGTVEIIQKYIDKGLPIKLVMSPGNRSIGRNAATKAAKNEIIACTDAGARLDKDWLKNITKPFAENPGAMVVSGFFLPEPQTYFEKVSTTLMLQANDDIDLDTWLPSSRSIAYKKEAWSKVGGYPEHTNFNEDTPFDLALRKAGYKFEDGLAAIAYWRPRSTLREYYRQYYFYAVGDGIDAIDAPRILKLTGLYILIPITILLTSFTFPLLSLTIFALTFLQTLRRVYGPWKKLKDLQSIPLMVLLVITYDISQMVGWWYGLAAKDKLKHSDKLVR